MFGFFSIQNKIPLACRIASGASSLPLTDTDNRVFSVIHKFAIFVLLRFENIMDREISHLNDNTMKNVSALKLIRLLTVSNLFPLKVVQKCQLQNRKTLSVLFLTFVPWISGQRGSSVFGLRSLSSPKDLPPRVTSECYTLLLTFSSRVLHTAVADPEIS